jgi:membrane fusion protein
MKPTDGKSSQVTLFRAAAVAFHSAARLGSPRMTHNLSTTAMTSLLTAIVVAFGGFIACGHYARKETVDGFLEPDRGVIRVFPQRGGVISDVRVAPGQSVARDDVLFEVADLQSLADGSDADRELLIRYDNDRAALVAMRERMALDAQRVTLEQQVVALEQLGVVQSEQVALADQQLDALRTLRDRGALPTLEWLARLGAYLQVREKLATTQQMRKRLDGELASVTARLREAPLEHAQRLADVDSRASAVAQSEVAVRARRNFDVRAPVNGRVVTVLRRVGDRASPLDVALTIIPADSTLIGRLLIPTSAIGFITPGQEVRIRFDAFPYQHFGVFPGVIREVARGVLFSGDGLGPLRVTRPAYPATIALGGQSMVADKRDVPLQSGMLFSADIVLEQRTILEWLIEPLLAMRGRA